MIPKISIITVVFNAESTIEKTIQSVINQTYTNTEYIIIDGASKDETVKKIKKYEKNVSYFTSEHDKGLYDAMNKGIKASTGDYIWFINSGDEIFDNNTISQIFSNKTNFADVYYGETVMIDNDGKEIGMRRLKTPEKLTWRSFINGMLVSHQSIIIKRDIVDLYDTNYRYSADFDWVIKALKRAKIIENTHLILSKFLDGGLTKSHIIDGLKERFRIMKRNYGQLRTLLQHIKIGIKFFGFVAKHRRY